MKWMIVIAALVVYGCATPYQKNDPWASPIRGGYSDYRLSDNVFRVSFTGNNNTSRDFVEMALLLRCAEISQQNGFDYFSVDSSRSETRTGTAYLPGQVYTSGKANAVVTGNTAVASGYTNAYVLPPQAINWREYTASATIVGFKEKPQQSNNTFDASDIVRYLGEQLKH